MTHHGVAGVVAVAACGLVGFVAFLWSIVAVMKVRHREQSRREIAAYVAEGTMTPEEGERLMRAQPGMPAPPRPGEEPAFNGAWYAVTLLSTIAAFVLLIVTANMMDDRIGWENSLPMKLSVLGSVLVGVFGLTMLAVPRTVSAWRPVARWGYVLGLWGLSTGLFLSVA